jgi:hypothetical protein
MMFLGKMVKIARNLRFLFIFALLLTPEPNRTRQATIAFLLFLKWWLLVKYGNYTKLLTLCKCIFIPFPVIKCLLLNNDIQLLLTFLQSDIGVCYLSGVVHIDQASTLRLLLFNHLKKDGVFHSVTDSR